MMRQPRSPHAPTQGRNPHARSALAALARPLIQAHCAGRSPHAALQPRSRRSAVALLAPRPSRPLRSALGTKASVPMGYSPDLCRLRSPLGPQDPCPTGPYCSAPCTRPRPARPLQRRARPLPTRTRLWHGAGRHGPSVCVCV